MTPSQAVRFGKRLRDARAKKGWVLDDAASEAKRQLNYSESFSRETLRRWEDGQGDEDKISVKIVNALADVYDVPLEELSPIVAQRVLAEAEFYNRQARLLKHRVKSARSLPTSKVA